ncbi:MAG: hypothetical protein IH820_05305, partial [Bacteroidetes bacterium]|nr:hypothetical protein [Bacteroidota bacterium]
MQGSQKYTDVIVKLNRLTKEGKLTWEEGLSNVGAGLGLMDEKRYRTRYQDKYFVIYQSRPIRLSRLLDAPPADPLMDLLLNKFTSKSTLTVEDEEGNTIVTFPRYSLIDDLMRTIENKVDVAEADTFLDNFL